MTQEQQPAPVSRDTRHELERLIRRISCRACGRSLDLAGTNLDYLHCGACLPLRRALTPVAEASEDTKPARCNCNLAQFSREAHATTCPASPLYEWRQSPSPTSDDEMTRSPSVDDLEPAYVAVLRARSEQAVTALKRLVSYSYRPTITQSVWVCLRCDETADINDGTQAVQHAQDCDVGHAESVLREAKND